MKITGGYLKSRKINSPKGNNVRPTLSQVRESIFSTLFSLMNFENKTFLDTFAGSGIMGFEAVSRGFENCSFIEKDKKTFLLLKENAKNLCLNPQFFCGDSLKVLKNISQTFDVIFVDPPYQSGLYDEVLSIVKNNKTLKDNGIIILEHPKDLEINFEGYEIVKQKFYADKCVSFFKLLR